jgi:hypothetical protein
MQLKLWVFVLLTIIGAVAAGYGSGMYHGRKDAQQDARVFLHEFESATDLTNYLQRQNQEDWSKRLAMYGFRGTDSYLWAGRKWVNLSLGGLFIFAIGLVGLVRLNPKKA